MKKAIRTVGTDTREGRVYFDGNKSDLIEHCGHYMLYGSEYITAIAAHLDGSRDYRQILKETGLPTIFVCDVPLKMIGGPSVSEFAGLALGAMFEELLSPDDYMPDPHHGAGFSISRALPPSCILGHYHPTVKRDPLLPNFQGL